jgi:hypothetical protein
VQVLLVLPEIFTLRGFKDHRVVFETGIIDKEGETGTAYLSLADMFMPVNVGIQIPFRIVQMKKSQPFQAD